MILAAGLGTRLKPFTDKHPKALAMVNGKSLLQRNIEYLQKIGIIYFLNFMAVYLNLFYPILNIFLRKIIFRNKPSPRLLNL